MLRIFCVGANLRLRPGRTQGALMKDTNDENYLCECNPAKTTGINNEEAYREAAGMEIGQSMIFLSEIFLQGGCGPASKIHQPVLQGKARQLRIVP